MKREIDSIDELDLWLSTAQECRNIAFRALDLTFYDEQLAALEQAVDPKDACVYFGCRLGPKMLRLTVEHHGLVFPEFPSRPYKPYRTALYTYTELFDRFDPKQIQSYMECVDWLAYSSFIKVDPATHKPLKPVQYVDAGPDEVLARRLHDHFIAREAEEFLEEFNPPHGKGIVAIMGGHDCLRSDPVFGQIAILARELARDGFLVCTGGGPGLMEAANLGAYFAPFEDCSLDVAIGRLASAARYDHPEWLKVAWEVRHDNPTPDLIESRSLGVPTWFYGHEPPNVFATHIAKYFENSLREEGLLAIATHGVIFAEGNAGTVQEIFQDACQNYYDSYGFKSPMILFGESYWDPESHPGGDPRSKPVWPLVCKLAQEKNFESLLTLTSDPGVALEKIRAFRAPGQE